MKPFKRNNPLTIASILAFYFGAAKLSEAFTLQRVAQKPTLHSMQVLQSSPSDDVPDNHLRWTTSRRSVLTSSMLTGSCLLLDKFFSKPAIAAVGTLPELEATNAILQGITVNVADQSQQDAMIRFLTNSFDFKVLRKRIIDSVEDTVSLDFSDFSTFLYHLELIIRLNVV